MHANAQTTYIDSTETLLIHRFSSIPPKPTEYLWNPLIPRGKISLLAADPGSGKTTLALTLAAHLSRGEPLPHLTPGDTPAAQCAYTSEKTANPTHPLDQHKSPAIRSLGSPQMNNEHSTMNNPRPLATLLLSPEDDPNDTLHPRLLAANANLEHIHFLDNLHSLIPQKPRATDHEPRITPIQKLNDIIDEIPNLALLVIDPITHYLGLSDRLAPPSPDDPNSPRSILFQLAQLARDRHIAILHTTRHTKRIDPTLPHHSLQKILGPLSFPALARSVLLLSPLPHREPVASAPVAQPLSPAGPPPAHAATPPLTQNKSPPNRSLGPTPIENRNSKIENSPPSPTHLLIPLKLSTSALPSPIPFTLTNKITFHPNTPLPAPPPKKPGPATLSLDAAIDFLQQLLADGPVSATQILDQARDNALSKATLTRARILLHIRPKKQDYSGRWFWSLPGDPRPLPENRFERQLADALKNFATPQLSPIEQLLKDADDLPEDDHINEPGEPAPKPPKKKYPARKKGGKQLEHLGEINPKTPPAPAELEHLGHRSPSVSEGPSPSRTPGTPPAHAATQPPPTKTKAQRSDRWSPPQSNFKNRKSKIPLTPDPNLPYTSIRRKILPIPHPRLRRHKRPQQL